MVSRGKGEHRLRTLENRKLRRIFRLKRAEISGGWRKLYITLILQ
jgi:hypothetical protein